MPHDWTEDDNRKRPPGSGVALGCLIGLGLWLLAVGLGVGIGWVL